jgi:photosystem II stability/assembly factor-like uncharacterized protein
MKKLFFLFFTFHFSLFTLYAQSWHLLPNSPAQTFRHDDLWFINKDTGWVVNVNGEIWKTKDGGNTWSHIFQQASSFRCVSFFDSTHGVVGNLGPGNWAPTNDTNPLYITSDGGDTWTLPTINGPKPKGICGLWKVNDTVIVGTGRFDGPAYFVKSTDRGHTWQSTDMNSHAGMLIDAYFISPDTGFVVGGNDSIEGLSYSVILYTTDGGLTWTKKITGTKKGNHCWKISHPSKNIYYVSVEELYSNDTLRFFKSDDGGNTWKEHIVAGVGYGWSQGIGFVNDTLGWIGGNTYCLHTADSGKKFDTVKPSNLLVNLNRIRFINDTIGYAVGQRVYKYYKGSAAGVTPITNLNGYALEQNIPNPFSGSTTIKYSIPVSENVIIEVFDAGGRKIATLVNAEKAPGEYKIEFTAPGWAGRGYNDSFICSMVAGPYSKRIKMLSVK